MNSKLQEKPRKTAPLQKVNHPPIAKMTYTEKAAKLVPNFAARWQLFRKYFPTPKSTIKHNKTLTTTVTDNTRFILKKKDLNIQIKTKSKVIKNAAPP